MLSGQEHRKRSVHLDVASHGEEALDVLRALSHQTRLEILEYIGEQFVPAGQVARDLKLPVSTATMHIAILEKAGLIQTEMRSASRGLQKLCTRTYDEIVVGLPRKRDAFQGLAMTMPIGGYSDFRVEPTCGLASSTGLIGLVDDPASFYEPDRITAQLLWFGAGYVEYRFPNRLPPSARLTAVQLTAEVCSEAPDFDPNWPSDIGVWINDIHLGDWTSPGDFGDTRGRLTPDWWGGGSMYGLLKQWRVGSSGTWIDGLDLSRVTVDDLAIRNGEPIRLRIGVREDAPHVGGLNIFGRGFGNYPQDIELRLEYELRESNGRAGATNDSPA